MNSPRSPQVCSLFLFHLISYQFYCLVFFFVFFFLKDTHILHPQNIHIFFIIVILQLSIVPVMHIFATRMSITL